MSTCGSEMGLQGRADVHGPLGATPRAPAQRQVRCWGRAFPGRQAAIWTCAQVTGPLGPKGTPGAGSRPASAPHTQLLREGLVPATPQLLSGSGV